MKGREEVKWRQCAVYSLPYPPLRRDECDESSSITTTTFLVRPLVINGLPHITPHLVSDLHVLDDRSGSGNMLDHVGALPTKAFPHLNQLISGNRRGIMAMLFIYILRSIYLEVYILYTV